MAEKTCLHEQVFTLHGFCGVNICLIETKLLSIDGNVYFMLAKTCLVC